MWTELLLQTHWLHPGMSWSHRTGSPGAAHLSLDWRQTVERPGGTKKTWRLSPTFLASFRTIKRGAPTAPPPPPVFVFWLPPSASEGKSGLTGLYHSSTTGQLVLLSEGKRFQACSFWLPASPAVFLSMGWPEVEEKFQREVGGGSEEESSILKPSWSELWYSATEAEVMCSWQEENERQKLELLTDTWQRRQVLKGYAALSIKTWERCESCWQGGILKKKLTEGGSVRLPDPPNRTLDLTGGQITWRDVVALTRVMGQMDLDGCTRGRGRTEWRGTGDQRGAWWRGRREGGGEISRLQASVEPCDREHCELEEKLRSNVWIYLHPTAEQTKLSKNLCSGQSMHPLFGSNSVCCGCGLSALGFSLLMPHYGT